MGFSPEWDVRYSENTHLSIWPWSDLVSYFNRYVQPVSPETKVLEIGFGAGANIPFFKAKGVNYSGIEGSQSIYAKVSQSFPELKEALYLGDFLSFDFKDKYDVVVDRASMTHNSTCAIKEGLTHLSDHLQLGGKYIGIDWFSTCHADYQSGKSVDEFTRTNMTEGQFVGVGHVHFSTKEHILELFLGAGLRITRLEHKKIHLEIPDAGHVFASWNLVAEKT